MLDFEWFRQTRVLLMVPFEIELQTSPVACLFYRIHTDRPTFHDNAAGRKFPHITVLLDNHQHLLLLEYFMRITVAIHPQRLKESISTQKIMTFE